MQAEGINFELKSFQKTLISIRLNLLQFGPSAIRPGRGEGGAGGGVLPYIGCIGMCRFEGYGFQAVYYRIGSINQGVGV